MFFSLNVFHYYLMVPQPLKEKEVVEKSIQNNRLVPCAQRC